nr:EOG090X0GLS [Cyclestheria hislopi]
MSDNFRARDIALKAQKKLLSRMSTKSVAKVFIDDRTGSLLDNIYRLCKTYTQNKKESEKIVKNIIKIVVKVGLLAKSEQFNQEKLKTATEFQKKFHSAAKTIISFHEVDFSYDQKFLSQMLNDCHVMLKQIVENHLTDKSLGRIEMVFNFFSNPNFLDAIFKKNSEYTEIMSRIVSDMHGVMDSGGL